MENSRMKNIITVTILMLITSFAIAEDYRSFNNSIAEIEYIDFIQNSLPGFYNHTVAEWQQTSANKITAQWANERSVKNEYAIKQLNARIDSIMDEQNAGIAGALAAASLPFASEGGNSFMIGAGTYNGQTAVAIGLSGNHEGKVLKFSFTADSSGNSGGSVGTSFEF